MSNLVNVVDIIRHKQQHFPEWSNTADNEICLEPRDIVSNDD